MRKNKITNAELQTHKTNARRIRLKINLTELAWAGVFILIFSAVVISQNLS